MSISKLRPSTIGSITVVNHFLYDLDSGLFKGGFIVPSRGAGSTAYTVRLSNWYRIELKEGYIEPLDGCKLTVDTPRRRVDYDPAGCVKVSAKDGEILRVMGKSAQMCFDFSLLRHPRTLAHYLMY
ncbi:hypothetical protein MK805_05450 [Shimazuella sp. AN120528]|nr:hypothetical protein [Shimazuella soli]